ncbi:MAG: HAMP domain-containing histidine kinase [FCB group bacterium]|nr:HAMP domain-containing histidine kinase [FCB group bacterium]
MMVAIFTIMLILVNYLVVYFSFSEQDTILDTHECYYYSQMVQSWGVPPDTTRMLEDLKNLKMNGGLYRRGEKIWSYPEDFSSVGFEGYSSSDYLGELHGIDIPLLVTFGDLGELLATHIRNGPYEYYLTINYIPPSDLLLRFVPASIITLSFMIILFIFLRRYLFPIQLMKKRIGELEKGDMRSEIPIKGDDELADLSKTINTLIRDIRELLVNKQQLLSEVSHELRSPLARMQLLLEMMPEHRNRTRLKQEIVFLETMIANLLLSDKLSMPYTNLELQSTDLKEFIDKVVALYPESDTKIKVMTRIPQASILVDVTKMRIAFRNILGNALKYGSSDLPIEVTCRIRNYTVYLTVKDFGEGISREDLKKITEPFYRIKSNTGKQKSGFGLGLAITKKVLQAHKGQLVVDSEPGVGSTFSLIFPQHT